MNKLLPCIFILCLAHYATAQTVPHTVQAADTVTQAQAPLPMAAPVYTSRKFEPGFKSRYTGSDFQYETKTAAKSWWDRFLEWLGRLLDKIFSGGGKAAGSDWVDVLIKVIAFILIGIAIYFIVRAILNKESLWIFSRSRKKIAVKDAEAENIHEMDFSQLIESTSASGNYRLAVRYYYLWLLKKLSLREIINWNWDKTNTDYLYEIKDNSLRKEFEYLSYVYDHSWYGDFPVDEKAFAKAEKAFRKTLNTL